MTTETQEFKLSAEEQRILIRDNWQRISNSMAWCLESLTPRATVEDTIQVVEVSLNRIRAIMAG